MSIKGTEPEKDKIILMKKREEVMTVDTIGRPATIKIPVVVYDTYDVNYETGRAHYVGRFSE